MKKQKSLSKLSLKTAPPTSFAGPMFKYVSNIQNLVVCEGVKKLPTMCRIQELTMVQINLCPQSEIFDIHTVLILSNHISPSDS